MPFGTRLFKLESCLAGMASAAFCVNGLRVQHRNFYEHSEFYRSKVMKFIPHFDCRVVQLSLEEIPNMLLWRERDCIKNAITLVALEHFSNKQIHKKNSDEKVAMLREIGIDFNKDIDEDFRYGSWFRRVVFQKEIDAETLAKIPEKQRKFDESGKMTVTRSEVRQVKFGMPLSKMANKLEVILGAENPLEKIIVEQDEHEQIY
jgi:tRNA(His) 5'-end guanylyltransferase